MKFVKLAAAVTFVAAFLLPTSGCSSESNDKNPKAAGPVDPKLKPVGRGAGGGPQGGAAPNKPGGAQAQGGLTKD